MALCPERHQKKRCIAVIRVTLVLHCYIATLPHFNSLHSLSAIQTPRSYPDPSQSSTRGPKCHPNIDMFWVISSDGISWEELACAKGKVHSSKSSVFPICHHMLQISHVFTKVRHWALSPRGRGGRGERGGWSGG